MKIIISLIAVASSTLFSCETKKDNSTTQKSLRDTTTEAVASGATNGSTIASADASISSYLALKNALAADDSKGAAAAAKSVANALTAIVAESAGKMAKNEFDELKQDMLEHATHITSNANDIKHQREHFQGLSDGMYELVKASGTSQTLYKDYCPMLKVNWLSETKEIKNPYYGGKSDMATCGEVKETLTK